MSELIKVASGPLAGHVAAPIDWAKFIDFKSRCYAAAIGYGYGSKDPKCGSGEIDFTRLDCSGFARSLLMFAAGGPETGALRQMPDGSSDQADWFGEMGFKTTQAADMSLADGHLRIAFHRANALDEVGHVFMGVNGHSVECFSGRGPGERPLDTMLHSGHRLIDLFSAGHVLL